MLAREILVIVVVFLHSLRWIALAGPFDIPSGAEGSQYLHVVKGEEGEGDWGRHERADWGDRVVDGVDNGRADAEGGGDFQCDLYLAQSLVPGLGRGIFAGRSFRQDEVIDRAPSLHVPHDHITNTQVTFVPTTSPLPPYAPHPPPPTHIHPSPLNPPIKSVTSHHLAG